MNTLDADIDGFAVTDVHRHANGRSAFAFDFGYSAFPYHVIGFRLKRLVGLQIEIRNSHFRAERCEPARVGATEPPSRTGYDSNLAVEFVHCIRFPEALSRDPVRRPVQ